MAKLVRVLLKPFALLIAIIQNAAGTPAGASPPPESPTRFETTSMSTLLRRLKQDSAFRTRFAGDPRATFRELGLDPTRFDIPERLDAAEIDRFLNQWGGVAGPITRQTIADVGSEPPSFEGRSISPPAVVYGPPPAPLPHPDPQVVAPPKQDFKAPPDGDTEMPEPVRPSPPTPVYGPPPGPRR